MANTNDKSLTAWLNALIISDLKLELERYGPIGPLVYYMV